MSHDPRARPAFYAARRGGGWRDWWTLLHPPYTAWHLSYVVIGACLAPALVVSRLVATLAAFFLAVGIAAHALDELHDRPLRTGISSGALVGAGVAGLTGALVLGVVGVVQVGWVLAPFLVVGPILVVAYNAELLGGIVHSDLGFALAWGGFPVLCAYVAQAGTVRLPGVLGALGAVALSSAQRSLSTPARALRRRVQAVDGVVTMVDATTHTLGVRTLLAPLERALRALSWAVVALATAMVVARLT